jgi:hypothetical protein
MDQEGGDFKVIGPIWARAYVAVQETCAVKIDNVTKSCSQNMPFANNVCIQPVHEMGTMPHR